MRNATFGTLAGASLGVILAASAGHAEWRTLSAGLELGSVKLDPAAEVTVVRVDPLAWEIGVHCASAHELDSARTAKEWCEALGLVAAVNAGMYATDARTHVGYLRDGKHVNSSHRNAYQSIAVFRPRDSGAPPFRIVDLDVPGTVFDSLLAHYDGLVQNLRLIKRPRENRWSALPKAWSEAALGEDAQGRALLLFCRTPLSMHAFNEKLLAAEELKLVCAQHLEGGRQAQLFVRVGDVERELVGAGLTPEESPIAWPIPNVLGIRRPR